MPERRRDNLTESKCTVRYNFSCLLNKFPIDRSHIRASSKKQRSQMIRKFIANEFGATAIEYGRIAVAFMTVVQVSAPS